MTQTDTIRIGVFTYTPPQLFPAIRGANSVIEAHDTFLQHTNRGITHVRRLQEDLDTSLLDSQRADQPIYGPDYMVFDL